MKKTQKHAGIRLDQFANSLGHINEKKLFAALYPDIKIPRSKSEPIPNAHSKNPCTGQLDPETDIHFLRNKIEQLKNSDRLLYFIAHLQLIGGLRISEVLNIQPSDIALTGHVSIKSLKNSANAVIYAGNAANYLISCKQNNVIPFSLYSRFYVYRQYKKHSINFNSVNSSKSSVTHAIRHIAASAQRKANFSDKNVQTFLRHKSPKSTEYYGKNQKRISKT